MQSCRWEASHYTSLQQRARLSAGAVWYSIIWIPLVDLLHDGSSRCITRFRLVVNLRSTTKSHTSPFGLHDRTAERCSHDPGKGGKRSEVGRFRLQASSAIPLNLNGSLYCHRSPFVAGSAQGAGSIRLEALVFPALGAHQSMSGIVGVHRAGSDRTAYCRDVPWGHDGGHVCGNSDVRVSSHPGRMGSSRNIHKAHSCSRCNRSNNRLLQHIRRPLGKRTPKTTEESFWFSFDFLSFPACRSWLFTNHKNNMNRIG